MKSWCKLAAQQVPFWNTYICLCWDSVADNGIIELCFFIIFLLLFFFLFKGGKKKKRQLYAPALRNIAGRAFALEIIKKSCKALIAGVGGCVCVYLSEGASRLPINHLGSSALLRSSSGIRGHPPHNATMPLFFFCILFFCTLPTFVPTNWVGMRWICSVVSIVGIVWRNSVTLTVAF